jgi:hypothetical protein
MRPKLGPQAARAAEQRFRPYSRPGPGGLATCPLLPGRPASLREPSLFPRRAWRSRDCPGPPRGRRIVKPPASSSMCARRRRSLGLGWVRSGAGIPVGLLSSWLQATSRGYGRSAMVFPLCWQPYLGRRQPAEMWLRVRGRCWQPYLGRRQPAEMWLIVPRSRLTLGARCAGAGRTCGPIPADRIEFACVAMTKTATMSASATRAALSLERRRAPVP